MTKATYAPVRDDHEALIASRLTWLVDLLTSPRAPRLDDPGTHFVQAFLDRHPGGVEALLHRWRGAGPFVVESLSPVAHKGWATLVAQDGSRHTLAMTIDTTGKVRRADLEPEVADGVPRTFADVDALLDDQGVRSSALVARKVGGRWESLYEREADRLMPGGSVYKVYLLLALARALEAGTVRWDDELVLGPEHRSLPTGEMQDLPDGTRASVYETAYNMFARSDNTASDLVLDLLGRDAVHDAVTASGHANPPALQPFLSSRELFEIGWGRDHLLDLWAAVDRGGREELLQGLTPPLSTRIADLTRVAHPHGLDWFMSARDVACALDELWQATARDTTGRLREITGVYPGVAIDREVWPRSLFKGGSTPGVVMFCWLLEDTEGVEHVVVLQQCADRVGVLHDGLPLRRLGDVIIHSLLG